MGALDVDTAVTPIDAGRYRGRVDRAWEIWGPMGGYIASFALRAVGAEATMARPASFSCHFLSVADFDDVDIEVTLLRRARTAESYRASITQGDRAILDAVVWVTADGLDGLEHHEPVMPDIADPDDLRSLRDLLADVGETIFPFWENLDARPTVFRTDWPPPEPEPGIFHEWLRFEPSATFDDPFIDACRLLIVGDVVGWPATTRIHAWRDPVGFIAPSLDLYVAFHAVDSRNDWLLADGASLVGGDGLIGVSGRVWSRDGALLATSASQLLCRPWTPPES